MMFHEMYHKIWEDSQGLVKSYVTHQTIEWETWLIVKEITFQGSMWFLQSIWAFSLPPPDSQTHIPV